MTKARWLIPNLDTGAVESLAREARVSRLAARVLLSRGFCSPVEARRFLRPSLADLYDPYLLSGMDCAVERLSRAIDRRESILLYGDYDVDGTTAIVILRKAIALAGGVASHHVPHRLKDGYGMRADVVEQAAADGVRLIVSVDTGIRASEVVRRASSLGIDTIITDHHLPEAEMPPAVAVLNPNRPDCAYPDKNLCGAGVAFKLVQALLATRGWPPERVQRLAESFLKVVAIATVADVVPLVGENRIIVKHGLAGLRQSANRGLRALLKVAGFTEGAVPSAGQIAFRVAPRINAAGRMDTAENVIRLFLTEDDAEAQAIATQLHTLNAERQQTEAEMVEAILAECEREPVTDDQRALVFCGNAWHRGVVGIVASRIVDRFHRPVVVLNAEDGLAQGSARSIPAFHLLEALESMRDLFVRFGGHRQAAGMTLVLERVDEFRERLNAYASARLTYEDLCPQIEVDASLELNEISEDSVMDVLSLAPFGFGNPAPLFAVLGAEVASVPVLFKEKHLRLAIRQNGRRLYLKAWNFGHRAAELEPGQRINAVVCFEDDPYSRERGYGGWAAQLREFETL